MSFGTTEIRELRERTGAGIMDCKGALVESKGDIEKAIELLRKKGIAKADKRAGRETKEGVVEAYIHPGSRLGILVEVNCETDFVANTDDFREFARDLAMQVAATSPMVVEREQLAQDVIDREREIYQTQAREEGKPDNIAERIAQGKLDKFYQEACLLEQSFIKDPKKTISELRTDLIARVGENVTIRRFVRFQLGEE